MIISSKLLATHLVTCLQTGALKSMWWATAFLILDLSMNHLKDLLSGCKREPRQSISGLEAWYVGVRAWAQLKNLKYLISNLQNNCIKPVEDSENTTNIILEALKTTGQRGIVDRGWGGLGTRKLLVLH